MLDIFYRNLNKEKCLGLSFSDDGKVYKIIKVDKKTSFETVVEINPRAIWKVREAKRGRKD